MTTDDCNSYVYFLNSVLVKCVSHGLLNSVKTT